MTIDQRIADLICSVKRGSVQRDSVLEAKAIPTDIGLDSLEIIELLLQLEQEFKIQVQFDSFSLDHLASVFSIASYIREQQAPSSGG